MDRRLVFPTVMFVLAGISFAFGIWQYVYAQRVRAVADIRMAHIMTTLERSAASDEVKKAVYSKVFAGIPQDPITWGIDISGLFASQETDDQCANDGQRAVCHALMTKSSDAQARVSICGVCRPVQ